VNLIKSLEQAEVPQHVTEVVTVPNGMIRAALLLTNSELESYLTQDGDSKFALGLTNEQLESLITEDSFFRIIGKACIPGDSTFDFASSGKEKAVFLNIQEKLITDFIDADFTNLNDARAFLAKAINHKSYVATLDFRNSMVVEKLTRYNLEKYIEIHEPGKVVAVPVERIQPTRQPDLPKLVETPRIEIPRIETKAIEKPIPLEPVINIQSIEETVKKVLDAEKPKKWKFTVIRNSQGLIESIEATTN
jgi:hypothetical protein